MNDQKELVLRCQPHIYRDRKEPFPIRHIGYTVFREKGRSQSFRDLTLDPAEHGAAFIIEQEPFLRHVLPLKLHGGRKDITLPHIPADPFILGRAGLHPFENL